MDFLENQLAGDTGTNTASDASAERSDGNWQWVDGALSQTIARAIRDATQTANPLLQQEAASWLLTCCPDIAEQVELPELHYDAMSTLAAAYVVSDPRAGRTASRLM